MDILPFGGCWTCVKVTRKGQKEQSRHYTILASDPRQCVTDGSDGSWAEPLA